MIPSAPFRRIPFRPVDDPGLFFSRMAFKKQEKTAGNAGKTGRERFAAGRLPRRPAARGETGMESAAVICGSENVRKTGSGGRKHIGRESPFIEAGRFPELVFESNHLLFLQFPL